MSFKFHQTFSREQLQQLPAKHRAETIQNAVEQIKQPIIAAATAGKAFHLLDVGIYTDPSKRRGFTQCHSYPPGYTVTVDDLVEGLKELFPGCQVEYTETWEDVRPGVKERRSGILVDWSRDTA